MEGAGDLERQLVIDELMQAYEWTYQLRSHLSPSSPPEMLTQNILCSFNKVLSMLKSGDSEEEPQLTDPASGNDSPRRSPRSAISKRAFGEPDCRDNSKKRKTILKRSEEVRVVSGTGLKTYVRVASEMGLGGPPEDGYTWRKYGQKVTSGARYSRSYFRCANNRCPARKHVQWSDEDPSISRVSYQGRHTCIQVTKLTPGAMATSTSGSNYFSVSPCHMNDYGDATMPTSGASDITGIISTVTSGSNSSPVDLVSDFDEFDTFPSKLM